MTHGHKALGAKWLFELWFSHQSLLHLDSEVATNSSNDFIPPTVVRNAYKYNNFSERKEVIKNTEEKNA
jgi:hypothetical protein